MALNGFQEQNGRMVIGSAKIAEITIGDFEGSVTGTHANVPATYFS